MRISDWSSDVCSSDLHNHAEPEEQVFAEFAFGDRGAEILVGGRNDADVDGLHLAAADADDRPLFEHAEQFDLHVETHVADFVEKERAALADRKSTRLNSSH